MKMRSETKDSLKIMKIVQRVRESENPPDDLLSLTMDLTACHLNGCPLDLDGLIKADDFDFFHDVYGVRRHLNRTTGRLENFFCPRYADREITA